MSLTLEELQKINYHLNGYRVTQPYIDGLNWTGLETWYQTVPALDLNILLFSLSAQERGNLFAYVDFQPWYSQFCEKIHLGLVTLPTGFDLEQIDNISLALLGKLLDYGLTSSSIQELIPAAYSRKLNDLLGYLLISFTADGIFNLDTFLRLGVEMTEVPRWQSLGLSEPPTSAEIHTALTTP